MKSVLVMALLAVTLVSIGFGHDAFAQNITAMNSSLNSMEPLQERVQSMSIFYPIFFLVALALFMVAALQYRTEAIATVFAIAATIVCIVLQFIFIAPIPFVYEGTTSEITVEEITWLDGNTTLNHAADRNYFSVNVLPVDNQFRFAFTALFLVLGIFNALLSILILTYYRKNKRV